MTQEEILVVLKELVVESIAKANPVHAKELSKLRSIVDNDVKPDSPLASLGWDSMQMTWLLVAVEEKLKIDTSTLSLFDLYTIGDFLTELQNLVKEQRGK